ncbi:PTS sugar transporter subunit IIA [Enterococcus termitis]|uniref:Ascorbate-specific PTS system EIIA component n=1 Tax=Enterococcus termitis TaxID=332950 RepID=A0A1E5G804_9ENTE|nr:PTS sugar transporter subunit IIA [Enterococcus termitis]OEG08735.1 PTS sugar transporter subunit IIB [Enterococcus termitis]
MLSDMIKKEFIQLELEVTDWEEAIRQSAAPLLNLGKITDEYVEKIIETTRTVGPYIVVTKHVALPHAPTQYGALDLAMGITTLKTPVISGNKTNDPVKYLFCMSAKDSETHLESMAELVNLLSDKEFYQVLDSAKEPQEILTYIYEKE